MIGDLFTGGGYMMWPLLFIGIGVVVATMRAAMRIRAGAAPDAIQRGLTSILFWGTLAPVLGLLGTVIGLMQMGLVVQRAGGAESRLVWGGITVALITLAFGLLIFTLAMPCWYAIRAIANRRRFAGVQG